MHQRRSGRIAKELPILLLGTDTAGTVFSEETKTVVLSRHGAGIISTHRFTPDDTLTLRLPGTNKEAEVRLAGQMGGEPGRYVYGVAFLDPDLQFWPTEFPPPEPFESANRQITFECTICLTRQPFEPGDIEEDVYSINGNLLRFCKTCGASTPWTKARGRSAGVPDETPVGPTNGSASRLANSHAASPVLAPSLPSASSQAARAAAVLTLTEPASTSALPTSARPDEAPGTGTSVRRANRRRHIRIRVNFNACIRYASQADEVVECENFSKGGLCFHSRRQYSAGSAIEIAAPYAPGEAALFVPARIIRVEPIGDGQVFRCGVAYTKPA